MSTTKHIVGLMEAYSAVYDNELRDELGYENELMEDDLSFLDDLSDNELVQVMEEIFSEGEYTLDECLDIFDGVLIQEEAILGEARLTPKQQQERQKFKSQQKSQLASSAKAAERGREKYASAERRTQRIERLKSAAERAKTLAGGAVSAVAGGAADIKRGAQRKAQAAGEKIQRAKAGVQKFLRRAGKQVTAGAERVSRTLQGRDVGKERGQRQARIRMRNIARGGIRRAVTGETDQQRAEREVKKTNRIVGIVGRKREELQPSQGPAAPLPPAGGSSRTQSGAPRDSVRRQRAFMRARGQGQKLLRKEDFDFVLEAILEDLVQEGYAYDINEAFEILEDLTETEFDTLVESYLEDEVETLDFYDDVMNYLVSEGFAETEEDATAIMANMSEDWRSNIIDTITESEMKPPRAGERAPLHIRQEIQRSLTPDPEKAKRRENRGKLVFDDRSDPRRTGGRNRR